MGGPVVKGRPIFPAEGAGLKDQIMATNLIVSALALTFASLLATNAQAMHKNVRRHPHAVEDASQARRSDLVPGTSATVSSENHYFSDTARYSYSQSGPSISSERLDLPGAPDPLFRF